MANCLKIPSSQSMLIFTRIAISKPLPLPTTAAVPVASKSRSRLKLKHFFKPLNCTAQPLQQTQEQVDAAIICEPCDGKGWVLCDFCKGQKTNVKANNKRIYRRCPSCRAIGYLLCSKCKVFKCVTFPDYSDGEELTF